MLVTFTMLRVVGVHKRAQALAVTITVPRNEWIAGREAKSVTMDIDGFARAIPLAWREPLP